MKTEVRFLLAIALMLLVLVGTNLLFPPLPSEEGVAPVDTAAAPVPDEDSTGPRAPVIPPSVGGQAASEEEGGVAPPATAAVEERNVAVEGPLYRYTFSNVGARLVSAEMTAFQSLKHEGVVDLVPEDAPGWLGQRLLVGSDTVDLTRAPFEIEPADGLSLSEGGGSRTLTFVFQPEGSDFRFEVAYEFRPESYQVVARGRVTGVDRSLLITDLGGGLAFAEADSAGEARAMAYVGNHVREGIRSTTLDRAAPGLVEGPLLWAAFKSKFFVSALMAGEREAAQGDQPDYLGGLILSPGRDAERVRIAVTQTVQADGTFGYRLFMGPQDYARLSSLGEDMEEVNPYGWKFFRPIVRPFVSIVVGILTFLHNQLHLAYGWVLILFGVLMRVVLWPLNQKAMRSQLKNMAVQPLVQEIQAKYKDNPEKLQKEMMRLYKEHGFNPLGGCLPMLLPWPVLIALFFVFQNTIELRGVPFLWIPDLSAPDPLYILPVFMAASMFLMQWVTMRSLPQGQSAQMKMMMYIMPIMMLFIFWRLASGLNLYYATANIATIPQQIWIANERKKVQAAGPPTSKG
jgi:YidC/Oxa1 family membrane protein insertase